MSSGIYVATAGAVAQSNALDSTANNIANASTAGFRSDRMVFRQALTAARSPDIASVSVGMSRIDSQAGAPTPSGNPPDLMLEGDGYFAVQTPNGARYTRAGNFRLDATNHLVTADGLPVRATLGTPIKLAELVKGASIPGIEVPPGTGQVGVAADGTVSADGNVIGKLELVRFKASQVKREGGTLFSARGNPEPGDPPLVRSGMLEASNVNVVRGVVDLVKVSRTYESLMRVIQGYHDIESRAARELGGPK